MVIPRKPIKFSMMGMKDNVLDCELILPLVVKDSHQQIEMLKRMMKIIQDGEKLMQIKNSKDKAAIIKQLESLEE